MYPIIYYVLVLLLCSAKEEIRPATEQIYLADPTIFQEDGKYYLYGTDGFNADSGFNAYVSEDMQHWKKSLVDNQRVLTKGGIFWNKGFLGAAGISLSQPVLYGIHSQRTYSDSL